MCPSSRDKVSLLSRPEAGVLFYDEDGDLSIGSVVTPFARDDFMLLQKKKQIQESTILLERMVCESEELDRRLEQQKREYNASLLAMKKIQRLLEETDYFLADQAKKMEDYKRETKHRRQQRVSQSENLLRILMSPSVDDRNVYKSENVRDAPAWVVCSNHTRFVESRVYKHKVV
jgi:hypothetical protein